MKNHVSALRLKEAISRLPDPNIYDNHKYKVVLLPELMTRNVGAEPQDEMELPLHIDFIKKKTLSGRMEWILEYGQ